MNPFSSSLGAVVSWIVALTGATGGAISPALAAVLGTVLRLGQHGRPWPRDDANLGRLFVGFGLLVGAIGVLQTRSFAGLLDAISPILVGAMFFLPVRRPNIVVLGLLFYLAAFMLVGTYREVQYSKSFIRSGSVALPTFSTHGWKLRIGTPNGDDSIGQVWTTDHRYASWRVSFSLRMAEPHRGPWSSSIDGQTGSVNASLTGRTEYVVPLTSINALPGMWGYGMADRTDTGLRHPLRTLLTRRPRLLAEGLAPGSQSGLLGPTLVPAVTYANETMASTVPAMAMRVNENIAPPGRAPGIWVSMVSKGTRTPWVYRSATGDWRDGSIEFKFHEPAEKVWLQLNVPSGHRVVVSGIRVQAAGKAAHIAAGTTRVSGPFDHSNLAGHSMAVASLVTMALTVNPALTGLAWLLGLADSWLTGSRAALVAVAIIGGLLILNMSSRSRLTLLAALLTASAATLALAAIGGYTRVLQPLERHYLGDSVPRLAVYGADIQALLDSPIEGNPDVAHAISRHLPIGVAPVDHAHNLILQYAVLEGIPGLLAGLGLCFGLLSLGKRKHGLDGLLIGLALFALNMVDFTIWSVGVYYPLSLYFSTPSTRPPRDGDLP